jgi:hypothetical protein
MSWNIRGKVAFSGNGTTAVTVSNWSSLGVQANDEIFLAARQFNVTTTVQTPKRGSGGASYGSVMAPYTYHQAFGVVAAASEPAASLGTATSQAWWTGIVIYWTGGTAPSSIVVDQSNNEGVNSTNLAFNTLAAASAAGDFCFMHAAAPAAATAVTDGNSVYTGGTQPFDSNPGSGSHPLTVCSDYLIQGAAASLAAGSCAVTGMSSTSGTSLNFSIKPGTTSSGVVITSSPATMYPGQTGLVVNGTGFSASGNSVTATDGTNVATMTLTGQNTTTLTFTCVQSNLRYGVPLTLTATNNASNSATASIQLVTASGVSYMTLAALRALTYTPQLGGVSTPSRVFDSATDVSSGCQVEYQVSSGSGSLTVASDGTVTWAVAVKAMNWRWIAGTGSGTWSSMYTWDLVGLAPYFSGPAIGNQVGQAGVAFSLPLAALFGEPEASELPLAFTLATGSLSGSGLTIGSSGITGSNPVAGTYSGLSVYANNADDVVYALSGTFSITINSTTNVNFAGTIPNVSYNVGQSVSLLPNGTGFGFTNATSYSETGTLPGGVTLSNTTTGAITGTLTGSGIPAGQSATYPLTYTGSGTGSPATSNSFTITVNNPVASAVLPDFTQVEQTEAGITTAMTALALVAQFASNWSGLEFVTQSIVGGTSVPLGTIVLFTPVTQSTSGTVKSPQLIAQETSPSAQSAYIEESRYGYVTMGATDPVGETYRYQKIPTAAVVVDVLIMNSANPAGSSYAMGVIQPTAQGGGQVVSGSNAIFGTVSLDTQRTQWTSVYQPQTAMGTSSALNVGLPIWQLLGLASDPALAADTSKDILYDVAMTALTPGQAGGNVALRIKWIRLPMVALMLPAAVT